MTQEVDDEVVERAEVDPVAGFFFAAGATLPETLFTRVLALSDTNSATSGALSFTKSSTASTCFCTRGSFQTFCAVAFNWSYFSRPARVPRRYPRPSPATKRILPFML